MASLESANSNYQEYVRRLQSLYTKALPYLRRSLQDLCAVAQVDTGPGQLDPDPANDSDTLTSRFAALFRDGFETPPDE